MNPISNEPFEIVTTTAGAISIKCCEVNEIMHNPVGPWPEANALYIQPSRLKERLATGQGDFVVYDVGLGAAANALAALHVARANLRENASPRRLHLVSFERDLRLLEFALAHADQFEHFQGFERAIRTLLDERSYEEPGILWELHEGDFLKELSEKYDKTPAQISLNWLISQGNVIPIPGAKNANQAKQNAGALGWSLTKEEIELLRQKSN